jgi:hypothetical protein
MVEAVTSEVFINYAGQGVVIAIILVALFFCAYVASKSLEAIAVEFALSAVAANVGTWTSVQFFQISGMALFVVGVFALLIYCVDPHNSKDTK